MEFHANRAPALMTPTEDFGPGRLSLAQKGVA